MTESIMTTVLVTGGSGFLASYVILHLLAQGYSVRTTIRSLSKKDSVLSRLKLGDPIVTQHLDRLTFYAADLTSDAGWKEAVDGVTYVMHVASPFPPSVPKDENDLIIPARDGALRVLKAASESSVKRVVMTSSMASIAYGHPDSFLSETPGNKFTEEHWTNLDNPTVGAYPKSKTIAERSAWEFYKNLPAEKTLELSVINPGLILGPFPDADVPLSASIVQRLMSGAMPGCPDLYFGIVDVRDVADMHVLAMTTPAAKGERFIAALPDMSMLEIAKTLKKELPKETSKVPTRKLPNFMLKMVSWFDPAVKIVIPQLGKSSEMSNEKAKSLLGWKPRSREETIRATAESLVKFKLI
jgi:nucleoside-diphosphate-sugar epimerase